MKQIRFLLLLLILVSFLSWAVAQTPDGAAVAPATTPAVAAEDEPSAIARRQLTIESAQAMVDRLKAQANGEEGKSELPAIWEKVLAQLQAAEQHRAETKKYQEGLTATPDLLAKTKLELANVAKAEPPQIPADSTLADVEALLTQAKNELESQKQNLTKLEEEIQRRSQLRTEIPQRVNDLERALSTLTEQLAAVAGNGSAGDLDQANAQLLRARQQALKAETERLQAELAYYQNRVELKQTQRDLAVALIAQAEKRYAWWQEKVTAFRKEEAARTAKQVQEQARKTIEASDVAPGELPALTELKSEITELGNSRKTIAEQIANARTRLNEISEPYSQLQTRFERIKKREKAAGLTKDVAIMLRKLRDEIQQRRRELREISDWRARISSVDLQQIEIQEKREALLDMESEVATIMAQLDSSLPAEKTAQVELAVRELLGAKRELLGQLSNDYNTYLDALGDLVFKMQDLTGDTESNITYIDERIFWVRSASMLHPRDVWRMRPAVGYVLSPTLWAQALALLWDDLIKQAALSVLVGLLFFMLLIGRGRVRNNIEELAEKVTPIHSDSFRYTLRALVLTFFYAIPTVVLLAYLGWRCGQVPGSTEAAQFTAAVGRALLAMTTALLLIRLLQALCLRRGLAEVHFRLPRGALDYFNRHMFMLLPLVLPCVFFITLVYELGVDLYIETLGRILFIVMMVGLAVILQRLLNPKSGLFQKIRRKQRQTWSTLFGRMWHPLGVSIPFALAVACFLGYDYTASQLALRLQPTLRLILLVLLGQMVLIRWLWVAQRRLALEKARKMREAQTQPKAETGEGAIHVEEPEIDIFAMNQQTRQLLKAAVAFVLVVGLWLTWSDVLPALNVLDRVHLWQVSGSVDESPGLLVPTPADGFEIDDEPSYTPQVYGNWITLADLALAIVIAIMTVLATKNIPGLLEISLLQRLPLDSGSRFAITTITRYILGIVGLVIAFGVIGVGWSQVQWLAAAITVGLGFGLQEIFANFISGLIILFERPMRVGDTVTTGDVTGTVSQIRIRATTITDWDRKELVVPNREFITGRLVNWSLSDTILRLILPVGIAYGSDTELAYRLLHQVAREHPAVLDDPKPLVLFQAFGDNSLHFELRVHIPSISHFLATRHELNMAIDQIFRQNDITIAFPQRDVHFDINEPLTIRLLREGRRQITEVVPPSDEPQSDA